MRELVLVIALVSVGLVGCVDDQPAPDTVETSSAPNASAPLVPDFVQSHDHADTSLHDAGRGLEQVAYHNLVPGSDGTDAADRGAWLNTEIALHADRAFVGYAGAGSLVSVVDVSDPSEPELLGTADGGGAWAMDVDASEDGEWAYVSVYNGPMVGTVFASDYATQSSKTPVGPAGPGVAVVDARDPESPEVTGFLPIHGLGPHTAVHHTMPDGDEYVFANKAEGGVPGNAIVAAEVVETPTGGRTLTPVSEFHLDALEWGSFPHDVDVAQHPVTDQVLLYAAWWNEGLVVLDVTDPSDPQTVGHFEDYPEDEEIELHDVHPFPELVDGSHYTVSAPEIDGGETTGHVRIYETTDPSEPELVGSWEMPGNYTVDELFVFSTHNFDFLPDGRIALAHGHAGVWVLDWLGPGGTSDPDPERIENPTAQAYHLPSETGGPVPDWNPVTGSPWVWGTQVDDEGRIWAADATTGLYAFEPREP